MHRTIEYLAAVPANVLSSLYDVSHMAGALWFAVPKTGAGGDAEAPGPEN